MAKGGHGGGGGHESHVVAHPKVHLPHAEHGGSQGPALGIDVWEKVKKFFKSITETRPGIPSTVLATGFYLMTGVPLGESFIWGLQTGIEVRDKVVPKIEAVLNVKGGGAAHGGGGGAKH